MDDARRYLLATDKRGTILWNTPQAARLIILLEPEEQTHVLRLPEYVRIWLGEQFDSEMATSAQLMLTDTVEHQILISYIGQSGKDEYLLRIIENNFATTQTRLSKNFGLTTREAEVLAWLATGKSNRDIGSILDLSPRTINKHLERIHSKLGVENRTAAAAMALNAM